MGTKKGRKSRKNPAGWRVLITKSGAHAGSMGPYTGSGAKRRALADAQAFADSSAAGVQVKVVPVAARRNTAAPSRRRGRRRNPPARANPPARMNPAQMKAQWLPANQRWSLWLGGSRIDLDGEWSWANKPDLKADLRRHGLQVGRGGKISVLRGNGGRWSSSAAPQRVMTNRAPSPALTPYQRSVMAISHNRQCEDGVGAWSNYSDKRSRRAVHQLIKRGFMVRGPKDDKWGMYARMVKDTTGRDCFRGHGQPETALGLPRANPPGRANPRGSKGLRRAARRLHRQLGNPSTAVVPPGSVNLPIIPSASARGHVYVTPPVHRTTITGSPPVSPRGGAFPRIGNPQALGAGRSTLTGTVYRVTSVDRHGTPVAFSEPADRQDFKRLGKAQAHGRRMARKYGGSIPIIKYRFSATGTVLDRSHYTSVH